MKRGDHRVTSEEILDAGVKKADINDEVVEKIILSAVVPANGTVKWIADSAYTIVHVTFNNISGTAFTSAGSVTNAGATVVSSSSALAGGAVEEFEGASLSNTEVADGNEIDLNAGDQNTFIAVTMARKVNA